MVFDLSKINGLGDFTSKTEQTRQVFLKNDKAFLILNRDTTMEVRCDKRLSQLLQDKYESIMESRYFGKGGIEIVLAGNQLSQQEIIDLIRLSYDITNSS